MNFVIAFAPLFSKPVFNRVKVLVAGAILSPGIRTVTNALRVTGRRRERYFHNYHRVLNRAEWSCLGGSKILLELLIKAFDLSKELVVGLDDHLERRRGAKIKAKGIYHDAVASSKSFFVKASGLRWLSFMVLTEIPFAKKVWALPFLTILCPSEKYHERQGVRHRKLTDRARQAIELIARWVGEAFEVVVVADTAYAAIEFLHSVRGLATVVTKIRWDAGLYEPAPDPEPGQKGRPRVKGKRLPKLKEVAADPLTVWEKVTVKWYGQRERVVELTSGECVWYRGGKPPVPIRWVIIRDPREEFEKQALLCTRLAADPVRIVEWYVKRWQVEVTFEESRRHLGIETQRQWSDKAIKRTTPCLFGLFSLMTMMAQELSKTGKLKVQTASWYRKEAATFSDAIGCVRQYLWEKKSFLPSVDEDEMIKIPRVYVETLMETLCFVT